MTDWKIQTELLGRNTVKIIPEGGLLEKLKAADKESKPLVIKLGADPSAPDIHFGHLVVLKKLAEFQKFGHKVTFIIGDFTGMIGDPTGKNETRKRLTRETVQKNAETYAKQVFKVLDPDLTEICFNSSWFEKIDIYDFLEITSKYTIARMLERNDFSKRFQSNQPISILEFLYPLVQGYDSVAIKADIELGGTDQEFNLIVGRTIQERYGVKPQTAMIMPIIEGLDGKQKMSKSLNNYIGINDEPNDMFGKIMSIPDSILPKYISLLSNMSPEDKKSAVDSLNDSAVNPRDVKMRFGVEMVSWLHSAEEGEKAKEDFITRFVKKDIPDDLEETVIQAGRVIDIVKELLPKLSKGDIKRLIKQNGIEWNDVKVDRTDLEVSSAGILKVGKRNIFKIKIKEQQ